MPISEIKAVPCANRRSSAVCTWVCVPTTAVHLPSKYHAMAAFSEVASACMSTRMVRTELGSDSSSRSTAAKGQSAGSIKTLPIRLIKAAQEPSPQEWITHPLPGAEAA
ncbi:MAG: hypothetical protein BWY09_03019 [Candidatus Hydrogenedentes bacterium ADurb.Bin179]|nr:MAG: hypothetical protein BWY09_03019 [Candidatus Hydrogenedentes bacterium ADurb.Bin179]